MKFRVWDELNGCESDAKAIEAWDAQRAAIKYARQDTHHTRNRYADYGEASCEADAVPLCVRAEDGTLSRWGVYVEDFEPVYAAVAVETA